MRLPQTAIRLVPASRDFDSPWRIAGSASLPPRQIKNSPEKSGDNVPRQNTEPGEQAATYRFGKHAIWKGIMSDTDQIFETDLPAAPRPACPKCGMRMIMVHKPQPCPAHECLRCGHVEPQRR
jgi:hypothetical protein